MFQIYFFLFKVLFENDFRPLLSKTFEVIVSLYFSPSADAFVISIFYWCLLARGQSNII